MDQQPVGVSDEGIGVPKIYRKTLLSEKIKPDHIMHVGLRFHLKYRKKRLSNKLTTERLTEDPLRSGTKTQAANSKIAMAFPHHFGRKKYATKGGMIFHPHSSAHRRFPRKFRSLAA